MRERLLRHGVCLHSQPPTRKLCVAHESLRLDSLCWCALVPPLFWVPRIRVGLPMTPDRHFCLELSVLPVDAIVVVLLFFLLFVCFVRLDLEIVVLLLFRLDEISYRRFYFLKIMGSHRFTLFENQSGKVGSMQLFFSEFAKRLSVSVICLIVTTQRT